MEDQNIVAEIYKKNEVVFEEVVNHYSKILWVIAYSVIGNRTSTSDVEELVSDVFFRFWQHPEKFDPMRGSLKNYLVLLTRSMAINKLQLKQYPVEPDSDFILETLPAKSENDDHIWHNLFKAIELLSEPTKNICFQRFILELKPAIISENLKLSIKEVNNRIYRGKKKIKPILRQLIEKGEL